MKQSYKRYWQDIFASKASAQSVTIPPLAGTQDAHASIETGFPDITLKPATYGGKPPYGSDFNGLFQQLSRTAQLTEAGQILDWSPDFLSGYPRGALTNYKGGLYWSLQDDNTQAPEQEGWLCISTPPTDLSPYALLEDIPVGLMLPWPTVKPPQGWIVCQGQTFDIKMFPQLGAVYQGWLPDMRGNYVCGWDPRGVSDDPGRGLLTWQGDAIREIWGNFYWAMFGVSASADGAFKVTDLNFGATTGNIGNQWATAQFNAGWQVPTAAKNRPSNWSFNMIVRAK